MALTPPRCGLLLDRNLATPVPSKAWKPRLGQQGVVGAVADIVNTRIDGTGARDFDPERRVEPAAIELAQHQGEVRPLGVPGGLEVGPELDLRRAVRAAGCELPAPVGWLLEAKLGDLGLQSERGLFERER